jgi:hypothetical protein
LLDAGAFPVTCSIVSTCCSARYRRVHSAWIILNSNHYTAMIDRLSLCLFTMLDTEVRALVCWYSEPAVFAIRSLVYLSTVLPLRRSTLTNITLLVQCMTFAVRIYKPLSTLRYARRALEIDASTSSESVSRRSTDECAAAWTFFTDLLLLTANDRMVARRSALQFSICEAPDVSELPINIPYVVVSDTCTKCNVEMKFRDFGVCDSCQMVTYCSRSCRRRDLARHVEYCLTPDSSDNYFTRRE